MAFSTPLISCSSGVTTVSAIVFGDAPGYCPRMITVGGTISGYWLIGSCGIDTRPTTTITIEITEAKIGRSMKNDEMFIAGQPAALTVSLGCPIVVGFDCTCMPGRTPCKP